MEHSVQVGDTVTVRQNKVEYVVFVTKITLDGVCIGRIPLTSTTKVFTKDQIIEITKK